MNQIHPMAIVDPEAKLGDNNVIGPFCVIDKNVIIGDNNKHYTMVHVWATVMRFSLAHQSPPNLRI